MPSTAETLIFGPVNERTSTQYTATLRDETGAVVPDTSLSSLLLTLYVPDANLTIVNGRDSQNVLNANGVTVDASGVLTWTLTPDDTAILDDALEVEQHIALLTYTWGINKAARHRFVVLVRNLAKVS
jgi:hypothetical protein